MQCFAIGAGGAAWSAAIVLAIVDSLNQSAHQRVMPWILVTLAVGITSTICVLIERSRVLVLDTMHAEFEGEVTQRHLSAI